MLTPQDLQLLRDLAPQVLGVVARRHRNNFASAEDAVQEALLAAAQKWPEQGIPTNPKAWLIQTALRRMTDLQRNEIARRKREEQVPDFGYLSSSTTPHDDLDDTLNLFFLCCHPSLSQPSAIALTLRAVGGLTTAEIAKAFLVPEATMGQRISRAKQSIAASQIPFEPLTGDERRTRLAAVLHIVYLIFNEGYTASSGTQLHRHDLASEAIRLARLLNTLEPNHGNTQGLLALLLLTDARRHARTAPTGELIPLDQQDRSLWNTAAITEGTHLLQSAMTNPEGVGPYTIQAAIAAIHDEAPSTEQTDWPQILALYDILRKMQPGPLQDLNYAIAEAMVHGPEQALQRLATIQGLDKNHRLAAVRAHLLEMAGDLEHAIEQYRLAASRTANTPEQRYLLTRAAQLAGSSPKQK
ncbi:RNA polymerase sigma24 factor [Bryobacterales bacterium F-183]|nr:RNA polymerase sigma24 factor [Bryobacterales bacterium F-183]